MNDNCLEEQIKNSLQKFLFCPINNRTKEEIKEQLNLILNENDFVIEEEDSNISIIVTIDGVETKYEFQM